MFGENFNINLGLLFFVLWEASWKGIGLWKSAKKGDIWYFIGMFIINSFGILPIFYLWRSKQLDGVLKDTKHFFTVSLTSRFKKK